LGFEVDVEVGVLKRTESADLGISTRPKDPLRVLGEFLLQRSKELEGKDGVSGSGS
jgi:hypothetical protein